MCVCGGGGGGGGYGWVSEGLGKGSDIGKWGICVHV